MTEFHHVDPAVIQAAAKRGDHWYPHAQRKPIPEASTQPAIVPWSVIYHTMAGPRSTSPENLWTYINRGDINGECHLILGYSSIIQALPFNVRADNNYKANSWFVGNERRGSLSVEAQDDGANYNIEDDPWTSFQLEHLAGFSAFAHLRYGIPLDRVEGNWQDAGCDGHRAWPEWSVYTGKTCPGGRRWEQIPDVLALAAEIVDWRPTPPPPPTTGDDMLVIRFDGDDGTEFADQGLFIPIDTPEARRKFGIPDSQPPVRVRVNRAEAEKWLPYKLTPLP